MKNKPSDVSIDLRRRQLFSVAGVTTAAGGMGLGATRAMAAVTDTVGDSGDILGAGLTYNHDMSNGHTSGHPGRSRLTGGPQGDGRLVPVQPIPSQTPQE